MSVEVNLANARLQYIENTSPSIMVIVIIYFTFLQNNTLTYIDDNKKVCYNDLIVIKQAWYINMSQINGW